jgi:hypothetical protein
MNIKLMITVLAAIICAFVISGYSSLNTMQRHYAAATVQTQSATRDIGLSFDWYGLTLVDTTVKYLYGMISSQDALHRLKEGQAKNAILLQKYYANALPEESEESAFIRSQDDVVNKILVELYAAIETQNTKAINELLPNLYTVTDQLCAKINRVIEIKTASASDEKGALGENMDELRRFLFISFALCLSLCIGMAIPDAKEK